MEPLILQLGIFKMIFCKIYFRVFCYALCMSLLCVLYNLALFVVFVPRQGETAMPTVASLNYKTFNQSIYFSKLLL